MIGLSSNPEFIISFKDAGVGWGRVGCGGVDQQHALSVAAMARSCWAVRGTEVNLLCAQYHSLSAAGGILSAHKKGFMGKYIFNHCIYITQKCSAM